MDDDALRALHAGRAYHDWSHIEALLRLCEAHAGALHDIEAVRLAIRYHDAVYDPRARDNEAASARLLRAAEAGRVPPARLEAATAMILATAEHRVPPDMPAPLAHDTRYLLDMDLAILGADADRFDAYDAAIRAEYAHVPEADYRAGRAAVLRGLLARRPLYLTAPFHAACEQAARHNLEAALARLA